MLKNVKLILSSALLCGLVTVQADARGLLRGRIVRRNANGGVTRTVGAAAKGPEGGSAARSHVLTTDGQGNATRTTVGTAQGPNGGTVQRNSTTSVSSNGAASHQGTITAQSAQ